MQLKDLDLREAPAVNREMPLLDLAKYMRDDNRKYVYIVNGTGIVGIISTTDIVYKALAENHLDQKAEDIMNPDVISFDKTTSLLEARHKMHQAEISSIPVMDGIELIGQATIIQIENAIPEGMVSH